MFVNYSEEVSRVASCKDLCGGLQTKHNTSCQTVPQAYVTICYLPIIHILGRVVDDLLIVPGTPIRILKA